MPALTASGVTVLKSWEEATKSGKVINRVVEALLVLSSQGGATNNIPASLFGLRYIREADGGIASDNKAFLVQPSYNGTLLLTYDLNQATDASRNTAADITATIRVTVKGY